MEFRSKFGQWLADTVLQKTALMFILLVGSISLLSFKAPEFRLDASADSLLLESDPSLTAYRKAHLKYGSDDYLFLLFAPNDELFSEKNLNALTALQSKIEKVPSVTGITSILDIPLFDPKEADIFTVEEKTTSLRERTYSLERSKELIIENPIYNNLIIAPDGSLTALQINLNIPPTLKSALKELTAFQIANDSETPLTEESKIHKAHLKKIYSNESQSYSMAVEKAIADIRTIMKNDESGVRLFLGGVPMIANDLMEYVNNDLVVFGGLIFVILILILTLIFRQAHWIIMPLAICSVSVVAMIGLLGWLDWPATVISSNFIALLLIMTMSLVIHLIVRFRELTFNHPDFNVGRRITETLSSMFIPCLFTALTTMVAFGSLVVSDIRPVKDFGMMMSMGLALAFTIAFIAFPLTVLLTYKNQTEKNQNSRLADFTSSLGRWTLARGNVILYTASAVAIFAITGLFKLTVDNRFIDYFRANTEIHQGMKTIDEHLGGTTPLNILIKTDAILPLSNADNEFANEFDDFGDNEPAVSPWFTSIGSYELNKIHSKLESYEVTGKVLSLSSSFQMLNNLNKGKPLDDFLLGLFYKRISDDIKATLINPYHNEDGSEIHFQLRMIDSHPNLKRGEFLESLHQYFQNELGLSKKDYTITGMFVLYNNMLESLFDSQIKTISTVFLAILLMFIPIFRSFKLALIGLIPNALAAIMVLGAMGWFGIPLDMMTIMIAAIAIGIGVDNTIHYIFRFRREFYRQENYESCVQACHDSIGKALYYTSLTVIAGFSVLIFSNFIPTIYFGILTSVAMGTALLANLTLLPRLLLLFKPKIPPLGHPE